MELEEQDAQTSGANQAKIQNPAEKVIGIWIHMRYDDQNEEAAGTRMESRQSLVVLWNLGP